MPGQEFVAMNKSHHFFGITLTFLLLVSLAACTKKDKAPEGKPAAETIEKPAEIPVKKTPPPPGENPVAATDGGKAADDADKTPKAPCEKVGMKEPLKVDRASLFRDGGSVDAEFVDADGNTFKVHLNNKLNHPERGTVTLDDEKLDDDGVKALRACVKAAQASVAEDIFKKNAIEAFLNPAK
jgi:hypothetical protein